MKKNMKALKIALNIVIWVFVAFAVFVTVLVFAAQANSDGVPAIGGKCVINVLTDSMKPTFNGGDMIISEMLTDRQKFELKEDDIISYYADLNGDGNQEINTHRIVGINLDHNGDAESYITQGDNKDTNAVVDTEPVKCLDVICRYTGTRLGGVGGFLSFLQTSAGFFLIIVLPLVAVFVYELVKFVLTCLSVKNGSKAKISAADEEEIKRQAIEEYKRQQAELAAQAAAEENTPEQPTDENSTRE